MTWFGIVRGLVITDAKQIARDRFLIFVACYSIFLAAIVRFGVPPLSGFLKVRYALDLVPYYGLISSFVGLTLGSSMVGITLGFLLLEARETRVVEALAVSPVTLDRFLTYRIVMPMVLGLGLNPLCAWIGGIGLPGPFAVISLSVVGALFAGQSTLAMATFADNKVQAFAVMKMVSGLSMVPLGAYFLGEPTEYLLAWFPPYWVFKAWWVAVEGGSWWFYALVGVLVNLALLWWMRRLFLKKLYRI